MDHDTCFLPGGYFDKTGHLHKKVELKPLSGREEELLADTANKGGAVQISAVLAHCVKRIGDIETIDEDLMRELLVGDRQYLMLKIRQLTFGDKVQGTVDCPWPDCGMGVDIQFNISNIPINDAELTSFTHTCHLPGVKEADPQYACFRLPNGSDQEALSGFTGEHSAQATTQLLWRCIQKLDEIDSPDIDTVRSLSSAARTKIEEQMQSLAPDLDLRMEVKCPDCNRIFVVPFELQEFFFGEITGSRELLRREVHYLAFHYHWSEQDILAMSRNKRQEYIELLADEIQRQTTRTRSATG